MKRLIRTLLAGAMLAVPFVAAGSTNSAQAYCEYEPAGVPSGGGNTRCTNSCMENSKLYERIIGSDPFWACPM